MCTRMLPWAVTVVALLAGCGATRNEGGDGGAGADGGADGGQPTPIHFGVMVHLEGNLQLTSQQMFTGFDQSVREVVDLFSANGAKLTIESEKPYAEAAAQWAAGDNALLYSLSQGLGVGTHCDIGGPGGAATTAEFAENKSKVDALVGAENNLGCSGGWGQSDWANAAADGGFKYLDGVVMMAYLGVPQQNRPIDPDTGSPYTDAKIQQTVYHDPAPSDLMDRIYPRLLADTNDLEGDAAGRLLLLTGEIGEVASLFEGRSNCFPNCVLTQDDFDVIVDTVEQAWAAKDHSRFAMMYLHFPMGTLRADAGGTAEQKKQLVTGWLEQMATLQAEGKIAWVTQKEAYEGFVAWQ
ncbi:MAG: hypothetical protein HY906_18345 [Deltaproteobacteria bacterium]|nr:hypothetical protein [Deltaproteobacteria bacterium]